MAKSEKQIVFNTAFKLKNKSFNTVEEIIAFSQNISSEVIIFLKEWFDENSFVEVKTSGSTGVPKIIKLQKSHMVNSARATGEFFNLKEDTTALLCMSPNFIAGKMMLVRALVLGWHLDIVAPISNPLKDIAKQYDFCALVPLQLHNSIAEVAKIKKILVGGGVVSKELLNKIQTVETNVYATYGMTETVTHIAVKKLNHLKKSSTKESHYRTLPNISISTDDRNCLVIKAPNVSDNEIVTNDVVHIISSTEFEWLGRFDSIINSGGIKLIPEQIEEKLSSVINTRFFVAGIPDTLLGEKLILVIELKSLKVEKLKKDILKKLNELQTLSKYEIPKEIYFIKKFIETPTGKINRNETLRLF